MNKYINLVEGCYNNIKNDIIKTPLSLNSKLSELFNANIYLKREDMQNVRSFKIRGALNKMNNIDSDVITTASAGNHAQGVAYSCYKLNKFGDIYVPKNTPKQKIDRIKYFGKDNVKIHCYGNNFNECLDYSLNYSFNKNIEFIHPFDDIHVIDGQATLAHEIFTEMNDTPDFIISCVGGGGLLSGITLYSNSYCKNRKKKNPKIIGVEPQGANSLKLSLKNNSRIKLDNMDTFVDGASVAQVGELNYSILKKFFLDEDIYTISNEKISHDIINIYQEQGIVLEPAGILSISCLDYINDIIKGKNVVCIVSGGNNDISRYQEMNELRLRYLNLKHYFIVDFAQKPGQLKLFINKILGKNDDIVRFEYIKKTNREYGKVLIGIELGKVDNLKMIKDNLYKYNFKFNYLENNDLIHNLLI